MFPCRCLTKENYFSWSPAMTMGIAGRGRMAYINGSNPEPARTSGVCHAWFLEDNQVKTWIVNSVSADIQPLILRKKTAKDMWVVLEQMFGQKKMAIRTYQIMKTVYGLRQGNSSVAEYYGALKAKWEELDYHSDIPWHCVRSQILNSREVPSIEDVYSCVEAEEQRRLVTNEGKRDLVPYHERSALVSRGPGGPTRSLRRCTHCKKTGGHTVDYCWDHHPKKKGNKGRSSIGKTPVSEQDDGAKGSGARTTATVNNARATAQELRHKRGDAGGGGNSDSGIGYSGGGGSGSSSCARHRCLALPLLVFWLTPPVVVSSSRVAVVTRGFDSDFDSMVEKPQRGLADSSTKAIHVEKDNNVKENNIANIKVVVRKRPSNKKEFARKEEDIITVSDASCVTVHEPKLKVDLTAYVEKHQFCFDVVLDEHVTNEEVTANF
ncbi:KINESIN-13A Kinesin-13A [Nymphaea thermarum]|nr:KINESIN-13A Kinesin-13A [Nymphaea thermarum]